MAVALAERVETLDIDVLNQEHSDGDSDAIILKAKQVFGTKLFSLVGGGLQGPYVPHNLRRVLGSDSLSVPIVYLDTGFYPDQSYEYLDNELKPIWDEQDFHTFGPPQSVVKYIDQKELWRTNRDLYDYAIKGKYLTRAIEELGIGGLITGVRREQTERRKQMQPFEIGRDGQVWVRPFLDKTEDDVYGYMYLHDLPFHPLTGMVKSVGDVNFMDPSGFKTECSIH